MSNKVTLFADTDSLKVIIPKGSPFLSGMHRVYFINVFGLNEAEKDFGYYLEKSKRNISDIIVELVEYFKEEKAFIIFKGDANQMVKAFDEDSNDFEQARLLGTKLKKKSPKVINVPNFKRKLKPYQVGSVAHITKVGNAANFSVPGSGKTTITLAGYSILKKQGIVEKLFVIGPRASFMSWEDEYEGCFGVKPKSLRITGPALSRRTLFRNASDAEMILLSYQMATQETNRISAFLRHHKVMLILDESHNIKKIQGGKWANTVLSIAPLASRRIILTGTPVPNSLEDLWTQMTFLWPNPKILGTPDEYKDRIASHGVRAVDDIKRDLRPFYWRIHKSQLRLKQPKYHRIPLKMRPYQQAIYDALAAKVLSEFVKKPEERIKLRTWRRSRLIRLLQTASNPGLLGEYSKEYEIPAMDATGLSVSELIEGYSKFEVPIKLEAVVDLTIKLIKKKEKVLIWTSFIHNIKALEHQLKKYEPRTIYGDVPKDKNENQSFNREKMIREFKNTSKYNILIANPSACAESVSLHKACHHAIYLDRTFSCAQYMQSLDRIHRIGLEPNEQVHYYLFQAENSIDQVIDDRLIEKQRRMLKLLDDDFALVDLDASLEEISEDSEEDADFNAIIKHLKNHYL
jgi:SNF2 family DNA or RNA helicase